MIAVGFLSTYCVHDSGAKVRPAAQRLLATGRRAALITFAFWSVTATLKVASAA
jgi:hypothetical protein